VKAYELLTAANKKAEIAVEEKCMFQFLFDDKLNEDCFAASTEVKHNKQQ
jgi:hypothetical protein